MKTLPTPQEVAARLMGPTPYTEADLDAHKRFNPPVNGTPEELASHAEVRYIIAQRGGRPWTPAEILERGHRGRANHQELDELRREAAKLRRKANRAAKNAPPAPQAENEDDHPF